MSKISIDCFKAYDVRGKVGTDLTPEIACRIGYAYGKVINPDTVAIGHDARLSSKTLSDALCDGLRRADVNVWDIGLAGTEEIYFTVASQGLGGGIEITGSHNPKSDNGIKFVKEDSKPISGESGLFDIKKQAEEFDPASEPATGIYSSRPIKKEFTNYLLQRIKLTSLRPLRIVTNAGNGVAGLILDELEKNFKALGVPLEFIKTLNEPDGNFPHGIPNPLLPENREVTVKAVVEHKADLGLAWDGDFDRCFFFDDQGNFIEGYYMVGLLAEAFLQKKPGSTIIYDPRLTWNTIDIVKKLHGNPVMSKTGHAFIKERMRRENAIYGGEMSAHHYFAEFSYCDSGMIPWLLVAELISDKNMSLASMIAERQSMFPCSGEINYKVQNAPAIIEACAEKYAGQCVSSSRLDGLSMEMPDWRFNLRSSNTEPLLRLNVESKGDIPLMRNKTDELAKLIQTF